MRVRGLKCIDGIHISLGDGVAPHAGAWIEIRGNMTYLDAHRVAPHAGAWIEIPHI